MIRHNITEDGVFWIVPKDQRLDQIYNNFFKNLKNIPLNEWIEVIDSNTKPKVGDICLRVTDEKHTGDKNIKEKYHRVLIESINFKTKKCTIRYIDAGTYSETHLNQLYTLRSKNRYKEFFEFNPKAIKCKISTNTSNFELNQKSINCFNRLVQGASKFELIKCIDEKFPIKCWLAKIELSNGNDLLESLVENSNKDTKKKQTKAEKTKSRKRRTSEQTLKKQEHMTKSKSFSCEDVLLKWQQNEVNSKNEEKKNDDYCMNELPVNEDQNDKTRIYAGKKGNFDIL